MRFAIVCMLLCTACARVNTPDVSSELKYLALGDSYTIGESVAASENFPAQLVAQLEKDCRKNFELEIIARTGWTTDELQAAISARKPSGTFDLVTLLIGVNNQFRGRSVDTYRVEFTELLQQAIRFAASDTNRVLVISIPDYGFTPFGKGRQREISAGIDVYNAVAAEVCKSNRVTFVSITELSRRGLENPSLVASDGLHPSAAQYSLWVREILKNLDSSRWRSAK